MSRISVARPDISVRGRAVRAYEFSESEARNVLGMWALAFEVRGPGGVQFPVPGSWRQAPLGI